MESGFLSMQLTLARPGRMTWEAKKKERQEQVVFLLLSFFLCLMQ